MSQFIEAWIDVGGTFTDCYLKQGETLSRCKILSSGKVPISCERILTQHSFVAPELAHDVAGFWVGATLQVLNDRGDKVTSVKVTDFSNSQIQTDVKLFDLINCDEPLRFELTSDLEAPVLGVRRLLKCPLEMELPPLRIRLGTTRGTNALLTRRGAKTALAITAPLEDLLLIGDQTRPKLFELAIRKPAPLADLTIGIRERLDAHGQVLTALDLEQAEKQLSQAKSAGCDSLAICLMHSYANADHEIQLEKVAQKIGFLHISRASRIAPLIELVARAQTTVVDAYLSPIVRGYLAKLGEQFGSHSRDVRIEVMSSAGGLTPWQNFAGKDSILSGPAGGFVALRGISTALGEEQLIGLDMGGTSTDVCRIGDDHNLQFESFKADVRILTPTLPIETVASGGGSICWFDGVALRVGPNSAGASPGPACYGRGGPLTITDLNVFLGRLPAVQFPFPLDLKAIDSRIDELLAQVQKQLPISTREALAGGLRRLANEQMAAAVRTVSISQGVDPRQAALIGFGGAAGQHVCEIAELLGMTRIYDSAEAGLLSALGMGLADLRCDSALPIYRPLVECNLSDILQTVEAHSLQAKEELLRGGVSLNNIKTQIWAELRYQGTDSTLSVSFGNHDSLARDYHSSHQRRFGYARPQRAIELVSVRVTNIGLTNHRLPDSKPTKPTNEFSFKSQSRSITRAEIEPGHKIIGPAVVLNAGSTLVIDKDWVGECQSDGTLRLERSRVTHQTAMGAAKANSKTDFDPVLRDCLAQRLSAIATQMGVVLQQTAISVNVKQRRDFSCAVFDAQGQLLANAPHVPVHLGAMGKTVRATMEAFPNMSPGDSYITNDPYRGGSHLPDVTVITPVFAGTHSTPVMFVANRAHHADIGGIAPGSMSISATQLGDEGVIISPHALTCNGADNSQAIHKLFEAAAHPPRNIAENLGDLAAQQAANMRGLQLLAELAETISWPTISQYTEHLLEAAAQRVRNFVSSLPQTPRHFVDHLDDGTTIAVTISFPKLQSICFDFEGSGSISATNFNANPSIVTAAVMYVLRCLIADELPLNEGVMRCVQLRVPTGVLNPTPASDPKQSPAVAAGNVETSQRVVDVLLGAFGAAAASQGTMNNLLFGNRTFGFYETICGGAGASDGFDGASAVHTHMTNTRLTDPEVLEARFPVRLRKFCVRQNSGGQGKWNGGNGVVREIEFLQPVELSLLTSRRAEYLPFGLAGGLPGRPGMNLLIKVDGTHVPLASCCHCDLTAGDVLRIETPGGGGYGSPTYET